MPVCRACRKPVIAGPVYHEQCAPKLGHWEPYPNALYLRCSSCKKEYRLPPFKMNYCPGCGAKMEDTDCEEKSIA